MFLIFTKPGCKFCDKAKEALDARDIPYETTDLSLPENESVLKWFKEDAGFTKVPQIFYGRTHLGGCEQLLEYLEFRYDRNFKEEAAS